MAFVSRGRQPLLTLTNKKSETVLHAAALACNEVAVGILLELKANPNALTTYVR